MHSDPTLLMVLSGWCVSINKGPRNLGLWMQLISTKEQCKSYASFSNL